LQICEQLFEKKLKEQLSSFGHIKNDKKEIVFLSSTPLIVSIH
jgi:hypothetical protein